MTILSLLLVLAAPEAAEQPAQQKTEAKDEKKICKTIGETGSRLGGKRECRTQAEWDRIAEENQKKAQNNMGR